MCLTGLLTLFVILRSVISPLFPLNGWVSKLLLGASPWWLPVVLTDGLYCSSLTFEIAFWITHSVKNVQIRSIFWSVFFRTGTEYRQILRTSLYSSKEKRTWLLIKEWYIGVVSRVDKQLKTQDLINLGNITKIAKLYKIIL